LAAVVNEHIATREVVIAIAPCLLKRSDEGIHGNAMAVCLQGFTVVKD
jgi:hypothetical protein